MRWTVIAGIFISLLLTVSASAETRAMLVGAFDYDTSFGIPDLKGPRNDIEAIAALLKKRGVTDVRIYQDSLDPQHKATRQNILDGFRKLAEDAGKGDFIYIHMSGHGSRQLDMNNDERDGLDEIFLPSDIGKPEQGANQVPNALVDDEIGEIVTALRRKGADVWFVLDSCHSGSGMRDASSYSLSRNVTPDVFGIDTSVRSGSRKRDMEPFDAPVAQSGEMGNYLAFYSGVSNWISKGAGLNFIPYNGRVGIATTTPRTTLHVTNQVNSTGTGDAYLDGVPGVVSKPTECLRLQGKYHDRGSGALLRFTNQHNSGNNPNTGEYNLAGIAGYDHDNSWGGGLAFYTSPGAGSGGDDLTLRMSIDSIGAVNIPGPTTGAAHGSASMLYLLNTPLIKEWQWTGATNNTLRVTFSGTELPAGCKAIYADVFMPQHSVDDHVGHSLGKNHGQVQTWTGGFVQPSTQFGNLALQQCFLSMPGQNDNFKYYYGNWWNSLIIPLDTDNKLYHTVTGESVGTQGWIYMIVKGYFH